MIRASALLLGALFLFFACGDDSKDEGSGDTDGGSSQIDSGPGGGDTDGGGGGGGEADAAPGTAEVECGDSTCDTATEECCVGQGRPSCVAIGTCERAAFTCDGPEDCGEQVCCASRGEEEGGTACSDPGTCGDSVVCREATDCPDGQQCCELPPSDMSPIVGVCADVCLSPPA